MFLKMGIKSKTSISLDITSDFIIVIQVHQERTILDYIVICKIIIWIRLAIYLAYRLSSFFKSMQNFQIHYNRISEFYDTQNDEDVRESFWFYSILRAAWQTTFSCVWLRSTDEIRPTTDFTPGPTKNIGPIRMGTEKTAGDDEERWQQLPQSPSQKFLRPESLQRPHNGWARGREGFSTPGPSRVGNWNA